MAVKPIPEGYRTVTPYLIVKDADALLQFVKMNALPNAPIDAAPPPKTCP